MYYYKVIAALYSIIFFISWAAPVLPEVLVFLHQAYFRKDLYTIADLSAFIKICHSLADVMLTLPWAISNFFDIYIGA